MAPSEVVANNKVNSQGRAISPKIWHRSHDGAKLAHRVTQNTDAAAHGMDAAGLPCPRLHELGIRSQTREEQEAAVAR